MKGRVERVSVENVNLPGRTNRVNAAKYQAMRDAMLQVLPAGAPGLTQAEIREAVLPHLPELLYPSGDTAGWWAKTVQLDLEAKGRVVREGYNVSAWLVLAVWRAAA